MTQPKERQDEVTGAGKRENVFFFNTLVNITQ